MKKPTLFFTSLFILLFSCRKDPMIEKDIVPFVQYYGTSSDETGRQLRILSNGDLMVCGYGSGPNGQNDLFLMRTDSMGRLKWRKFYGGIGNETCWAFDLTSDNGFVLGGYTNSFGAGQDDFYIVKTDADGNEIWHKTYGGASGDIGVHIRSLPSGFLMTGIHNSGSDDNGWILRLDLNGDSLWSFLYGGNGGDGAMYSCNGANGTHVITGYTNSTFTGNTDGFLLFLNDDGTAITHYDFGTTDYDEPHVVLPAVNGDGWLISGHQGSAVNISTHSVFLTKIGLDGTPQWFKTYGGAAHDGSEEMIAMPTGYAIIARSNSRDGTGEDLYLLQTDLNGNLKKERWLGTDADDAGYGIAYEKKSITVSGVSRGGIFGGKDIYLERLGE
jgi:hypothetical protein